MVHTKIAWIFYLFGALLTLFYKWEKYYYSRKDKVQSIKSALLEWFFYDSMSNGVSWVTTIGFVWMFGTVYIDKVTFVFGDYFKNIPVEYSISFFFGSLMEVLAPAAVEWVVSKIPFVPKKKEDEHEGKVLEEVKDRHEGK